MHPLNCLPYLRAFVAVAERGSIRRASDDLGLTAGAVSIQLKKLAELTGLELFEKSGRGLSLTMAGEKFAHSVKESLNAIVFGLHDASVLGDDATRQTLRISIPPALGSAWLAGAIVNYSRQAGHAKVFVTSKTSFYEIDWSDTDLGVVWGKPPFPGCWWKLLTDVEAWPVCSPRLIGHLGTERPIRSLRNVSILHEDDGKTWTNWAAKANVSISDTAQVYFPSPDLAQSAAVQGQGVALISNLLASNDIRQGHLVQLFQTSVTRSRGYYFVCPIERESSPLVTSVVAAISSYIG